MREARLRSILKGASYRVVGTITTFAITLTITGSASTATSVGLADVVVKVGVYYAHERAWNRVHFGKHVKEMK
jgi:uncharacterized membrane protein